jgi:hypothetical protein
VLVAKTGVSAGAGGWKERIKDPGDACATIPDREADLPRIIAQDQEIVKSRGLLLYGKFSGRRKRAEQGEAGKRAKARLED